MLWNSSIEQPELVGQQGRRAATSPHSSMMRIPLKMTGDSGRR
jgi:hypothetical protein